jgi:hypothetical protein
MAYSRGLIIDEVIDEAISALNQLNHADPV